MGTRQLLIALGVGLALVGGAASAQSPRGVASLVDANGATIGSATITQVADGVRISGQLTGLTPGAHGIHIHAQGACEGPDFASAGGHFNPHARKHGHANPEGAHAGDLPNLEAGPDGRARIDAVAHGVSLSGSGADSLFKQDGTALVVHAGPDDGVTDPAGNSGARVACGAIVAGPIALPATGGLDGVQTVAVLGGALAIAAGILTRRKQV